MLIDICIKFHEYSLSRFQIIERTRFVTDRRRTDRQMDTWGKTICLRTLKAGVIRPKKKIVVFQVPCQKKTGSVGRLYFFFFFYFFFANRTKQFFPSSPKKYRQCHQAVDPGDMYYDRSFINSG